MSDSNLDELKIKIFELKVNQSIAAVQIQSLKRLIELDRESRGLNLEVFRPALRELELFYSNEILGTYSDENPALASIAKKYFDEAFPPIELDK